MSLPNRLVDVVIPSLHRALFPYAGQAIEVDAHELFRLYRIHYCHVRRPRTSRAPTPDESDRFVAMLQVLVAMAIGKHRFIKSLDRGPSSAEVASDIVAFLVVRVGRFHLRHQCPKVLLAMLNRTIYRQVLDALGRWRDRHQVLVGDGALEVLADRPAPAVDEVDASQVLSQLQEEDAIDRICAGCPGDVDALVELIEAQVAELATNRNVLSHRNLPGDLRKTITTEQHALLTTRILRCVRQMVAA